MDYKKLYKQTYNFEKQTLQLGEQVDGFSNLDLDKLSEKLEEVTQEIKKKYSSG